MYIVDRTLDDTLHRVFERLLTGGTHITPTRGGATEFTGASLKIRNPRARLSRTEAKGKIFSCLGEFLWYLSGTNDLAFIEYYISHYANESPDGKTVYGAYGPRLFDMRGNDQVKNVVNVLRAKPHSRRAVVQLFDADDVPYKGKEIPCTCILQFLVRKGSLDMVVYMRSNDVFLGFSHDVFAFTMLQEIIANDLGVGLGVYNHMAGSFHLYDKHRKAARQFLDEGWQSTVAMPRMPKGTPWPSIKTVLLAEKKIRNSIPIDVDALDLDEYWKDLVRLLQIFALAKAKDYKRIPTLKKSMSSDVYTPYVERRLIPRTNT